MATPYTITTELTFSQDDHWVATRKTETFDEDLNMVEGTELLTGERAFAHKALEIIKRYETFLENQKKDRIALAKRLLGEVN